MEPNTWPPPPAPTGWYPDPGEPGRFRYWDGATWTQQPPCSSDSGSALGRSAKSSGLTTTRGICLILLALSLGFIAVLALTDPPSSRDAYGTQLVDSVWRMYFGAMVALCVIAWILGMRSLTRPTAHPAHGVIAGVSMIGVGLAGCALGFLFVSTAEAIETFIAYVVSGILFALGGGITTLLSAITLFALRRSDARPASA